MIKSGIINKLQELELKENEIYPFLLEIIDLMNKEEKEFYYKFIRSCLVVDDIGNTMNYFV